MFGSKLRSWMEAVRPRKKQQRKEKQQKLVANASSEFVTKFKMVPNSQSSENEIANVDSKSMQTIASQGARYSGANLSSPESAYSTGYSTDGTSPGAPPEYYINIRTGTRYFPSETDKCAATPQTGNHLVKLPQPAQADPTRAAATRPLPPPSSRVQPQSHQQATRTNLSPQPTVRRSISNALPPSSTASGLSHERNSVTMGHDYECVKSGPGPGPGNGTIRHHSNGTIPPPTSQPSNRLAPSTEVIVVNSGVMSPRQRNRIRTNPWVPGAATLSLSPCNSSMGLHIRTDQTTPRASLMNSPVPVRYLSPTTVPCSPINRAVRCASLSSSSCSSLSAASLNWDVNLVRDLPPPPSAASALIAAVVRGPRFGSASDEDEDCTLNEMMGKYDESYVYEKETDILSDSDPTDCETDIDTGQDGGDEDDPHEAELDFIDNGSFLEFNIKDERLNTGHCTYYNFELQRKCSSRKRTTRRSRKDSVKSEKRKRSSSSKKRLKNPNEKAFKSVSDGTRSAGATPVSVRRTKQTPISKLALDDRMRKRSNSVSIPRDPVHFFDQRDKEAERKYKELIVEAEHILKNMKTTTPASSSTGTNLSPSRRVPGPANKRVELLRTESKPDAALFAKNRLVEDGVANLHLSRGAPSTFSPRFSPKRNHITKFINSNSPIMMRREEGPRSPQMVHADHLKMAPMSPVLAHRRQPKTDLPARRSPKYRKKLTNIKSSAGTGKHDDSFSSDSEPDDSHHRPLNGLNSSLNSCPQSEPVKRKIYSNQNKTVAFNLGTATAMTATATTHTEISMSIDETSRKSCESLRQQVLLNTISNLKRSLEDQSASLKQVYRSSQNLHT